jgi:type IV pilus assembly protein PilX
MNAMTTASTRVVVRPREQGAVLIVSLIFLVILTMLGVTAMTGTTMEERIAGNTRDQGLAFQAAEAALRDARRDINGLTVNSGAGRAMHVSHFGVGGAPGSCNTAAGREGLCLPTTYASEIDAVLPRVPANVSFTGLPSVPYGRYTGAPPLSGPERLSQEPRYVIEIFCLQQHGVSIGGSAWCKFYRITARGYGRNPNTQVTLQEIFLAI